MTFTIDKFKYHVQRILPQVYSDSLSFYELLELVINKLNEVIDASNEYFSKDLKEYTGQILTEWYEDGTLQNIINNEVLGMKAESGDLYGRGINAMFPPSGFDPVKGDNATIDTYNLQQIIDHANDIGVRKVFLPKGTYLIDSTINLNGCSLEGVHAELYDNLDRGTIIRCINRQFTAISQGSLGSNDIQFSVNHIKVLNAKVGFEFNYVINSQFNNLYAEDCDTGFKLGSPTAVGSMFCEFNNFWTTRCRIGIMSQSKEYFNNNVFNNGYIQGDEKAMHLEVVGGYGAVNNVFNNVEFKSNLGRGITLKNNQNTIFNHPYIETGGNGIRTLDYCSIYLNQPVFGVFKADNTNNDKSMIYAEGGFRMTLNGGTIFLTSEYANTSLYDANIPETHLNIRVLSNISKVGSATGYKDFKLAVNEVAIKKEEQVKSTAVTTIPESSFVDIEWIYDTPFTKTPEVVIPVIRGSGFEFNTLSWGMSEKTATGGKIRVYNSSTSTARNVYFTIYAKTL